MRRRGLTRIVALVTLVSMLSCELVAYATEDVTPDDGSTAAQDTQDTDTADDDDKSTDTAGDVTEDDDAADSASSDAYVNERLELRYSNVSKGYTYKEYTGNAVTIPVKEAYVADESTAKLVNGNYGDATGKDAVEIAIDQKVTFKITAPQAGLYNMAFEYLSGDEDSILVPQMVLELNGKVPFYEANTLKFEDLWKDPEKPSYDRYENEIVSVPDKYMIWQTKYVSDSSYRYSTPLKLQLEEGSGQIGQSADIGLPPVDMPAPSGNADIGNTMTAHATSETIAPPAASAAPEAVPVPLIPQSDLSLPPEHPELPPAASAQGPPTPAASAGSPAPRQVAATSQRGEEAAYNAALRAARSGKTQEGIRLFRDFLQKYPNGKYAANADFWIGECLYSQGKYNEALNQFQTVNSAFPRHHKNADALLKAGMTLSKMGDQAGAQAKYRKLLASFPNSDAAKRARALGAR